MLSTFVDWRFDGSGIFHGDSDLSIRLFRAISNYDLMMRFSSVRYAAVIYWGAGGVLLHCEELDGGRGAREHLAPPFGSFDLELIRTRATSSAPFPHRS